MINNNVLEVIHLNKIKGLEKVLVTHSELSVRAKMQRPRGVVMQVQESEYD